MSRGDITKYEIIGQQPGDLFFKWLKLLRREEKQRFEFEAVLHGVKLGNTTNSLPSNNKSNQNSVEFTKMADNLGGKIEVQRVKRSKKR